MQRHDVVIVGGGHNALVASAYLARAGLSVVVLEQLDHLGGAAVSARAFDGHDARLSRYSYLVSLLPDALVADLGLSLELRSRAVASYTPYDGGGLLVSGDATAASFRALTSDDAEFAAWQRFYADVALVADAVAPTFLSPLPRAGDLRVDDPIWAELVEHPIGDVLTRRFSHDLVRGVVATDAQIGITTALDDLSLQQNKCFLYHLVGNGTGEWRVPVGGMGAVSAELERVAREAGADLRTGCRVTAVTDDLGVVGEGFEIAADWVLSGVAPWTLARLRGLLDAKKPVGAQLKVNLLVSRLPALKSGDDPRVAFAGTFHLDESYAQLAAAHSLAAQGNVGPACGELYCHTLTDRSILGPALRDTEAQTLTYFGLHLPAAVLDAPGAKDAAVAGFLAALNAHLAEPIEPLILGIEARTPTEIEAELGMPGGNIFHGDLAWPWLADDEVASTPAAQWGVATDHPRILICGSGARRGGAVSGIGGHNAAHALLASR